ncbi:hypothetical protein KFE25_007091 [Diacronema lutheri]|uniref:Uncharacterized protein n=1 Tax=Diacronema lutheri TaxID=2081491 RepID=A0A8J6CCY2_DIALT|nr:hypothetical protein KFE25_007091 [Diacronema lutheri]
MEQWIAHMKRAYPAPPPAPDGLYLKAGVPIGRIPTERQSLPLSSDLTNLGDPVRSHTSLEPLTHTRPRVNYDAPSPRPPNWITLNARLRERPRPYADADAIRAHHRSYPDAALQQLNPSAAGALRPRLAPSERVQRQAARAEELGLTLEQQRLDTAALRAQLAMLRPPRSRAPVRSIVWPQLATPADTFSRALAGKAPFDALAPLVLATETDLNPHAAQHAVPHRSHVDSLVLRAATSAYVPAGLPAAQSTSCAAAMLTSVSWGRSSVPPSALASPLVTHSLGLGGATRAP